jgi:hypothetical protein
MSVYLIMDQYWQYYVSEPSSTTFFLKLKLFSFCFRLRYDIINEANGCEHDIRSLRKLSICLFDIVQMIRKWKSESLITSFVMDMLWKINSLVSNLGR